MRRLPGCAGIGTQVRVPTGPSLGFSPGDACRCAGHRLSVALEPDPSPDGGTLATNIGQLFGFYRPALRRLGGPYSVVVVSDSDTIEVKPRPCWIAGHAEQGERTLAVCHPYD